MKFVKPEANHREEGLEGGLDKILLSYIIINEGLKNEPTKRNQSNAALSKN